MTALVTYFDPQPQASELPARLPSPFDPEAPHPLARRAAEQLQTRLGRSGPTPAIEEGTRGKMFGVLVVADGTGRVGYLRGFSGMIEGTWHRDGFVGPLFDPELRDAFWPAGEAQLVAFDRRLDELSCGAGANTARAALASLEASHRAAAEVLLANHLNRRQRRHEERARIDRAGMSPADRAAALARLARESRTDTAAQRGLRKTHRQEREPIDRALADLAEERAALERRRTAHSCGLLEQMFEGYQIPNGRGERRSLRSLFAPATPPGGSGDCAAPKLFGHAQRERLRPLALAEFWWGPPPATGGRHDGVFYPSCRGKCGPVLAHMLDGLAVDPPPIFGGGPVAADQPRTVFEDRWLVVVDKPAGLLSVPGRGGLLRDSVLARLSQRYPGASGPLVVHRLDLDTSGLLLAAKDAQTHLALQRQFCRREIDKCYVAWLDGSLAAGDGTVDLALRVDLDDRPRQIHDPVHGKEAITDWRVVARSGDRTRVALFPRTGRTHQLRVHAAHPMGIGAPIVGDRLYGQAGERLMLHAETLAFVHPHTGQRIEVRCAAPF
jgi:tRNA pseudouridine32 synthase/23S rRNA pseudouridine746 synthase